MASATAVVSSVSSSAATGVVTYEPTTNPGADQSDYLTGWEVEGGQLKLRDYRDPSVHAINELSYANSLCRNNSGGLDYVLCPIAGMKLLKVDLGPGHDAAYFADTSHWGYSYPSQLPVPIELNAGPGADSVISGSSNDILHGNEGHDSLRGLDGDDTLQGGTGSDRLIGSDGNDTADYSDTEGAVTVNLLLPDTNIPFLGDVSHIPCSGNRTIDGCEFVLTEGVIGTRFADTLNGNSQANVLTGGAGEDNLNGDSGDDTINAQDGQRDRISCGTGNDTANVDTVDEVVDGSCEHVVTPPVEVATAAGDGNGRANGGSSVAPANANSNAQGASKGVKSSLKVGNAKLKGKKIKVTVTCVSGSCKGMLRLASAGKSDVLPMLYKSISLKAGQTKTVAFSVTKGQLKTFKRKKTLKLAVSARITDDATGKPATFARALSIKTRKKK